VVAPPTGAVVLVQFPFSDLSQSKLRPAVVLADVGRGDRVLCQVTSKSYGDSSAVKVDQSDFASGLAAGHELRQARQALHSEYGTHCGRSRHAHAEALTRIVDAVIALLRPALPSTEPHTSR
jgi:mRNA interferase MazF